MTAPTPNNMPGAAANPQLQVPVSTGQPPAPTPPPAAPPAAAPAAPETPAGPPVTGTPPPGSSVPDENWREIARKHEARAKENEEKARQWDEAEAARRTKEENQAIEIRQANERAERAEALARQERIARETGVLPVFLGNGTEEEMRAAAAQALEWRGAVAAAAAPPPPQTAAVSASTVTSADGFGHAPNQVPQLTKEQFVALPPNERMEAVRAGQCTDLGIGKPQQHRRMGNQYETGAAGGRQ